MTITEAFELAVAIDFLDGLPQTPSTVNDEMKIGKNDPKNGQPDYWWAAYGTVYISGYYSLSKLMVDLANQIKIKKMDK